MAHTTTTDSENKIHSEQPVKESESSWAPLKNELYRNLWMASVASNIGTWVHDIGASWTMMSLSPSPFWVSLVQTAAMLPMFILAIPSGALSDLFDRRKILMGAQIWMGLAALVLASLAWSKAITIQWLLAITFLLGIGNAMSGPAWQAIIPSIVDKKHLPSAVALQGIGINAARAIGPAIGGFMIGTFGTYSAFVLNAISYLGVILALTKKPPKKEESTPTMPKEHFWLAIQSGIRYIRFSKSFQSVLIRAAAFMIFASSLWSLLPIFVKQTLQMEAAFLGWVMACIGFGAVLGAFCLPTISRFLSADQQLVFGGATLGLCLLSFPWIQTPLILFSLMVLTGISWTLNLAKLNVSAQHSLPDWVRARGLAVYLVIFFGCMAFASMGWGALADQSSVKTAWMVAGSGLIITQVLSFYFPLNTVAHINLTPSQHWPTPIVALENETDERPVLISIDYQIDPQQRNQFLGAIKPLRVARYQTGALRWELIGDKANPGKITEQFLVSSWKDHLRQHERVTEDDKQIQGHVHQFHQGEQPPDVTHWECYSP